MNTGYINGRVNQNKEFISENKSISYNKLHIITIKFSNYRDFINQNEVIIIHHNNSVFSNFRITYSADVIIRPLHKTYYNLSKIILENSFKH